MNERVLDLLVHGDVQPFGEIPGASNTALLVSVESGDDIVRAVLKPVEGETPLLDFPEGSLAAREAAAFALSDWLGLDCIPPTVQRHDLGELSGSLQAFVIQDADTDRVRPFPQAEIPHDWEPVFAAETEDGSRVVVAHDGAVRELAFFDLLANNADRKGSHVFYGSVHSGIVSGMGHTSSVQIPDVRECGESHGQSHVYGIDNGLSFHIEDKLRTVLWGFTGTPLNEAELAALERLEADADGLDARLEPYLSRAELDALHSRACDLAGLGVFPDLPTDRYPLPWPPL